MSEHKEVLFFILSVKSRKCGDVSHAISMFFYLRMPQSGTRILRVRGGRREGLSSSISFAKVLILQ